MRLVKGTENNMESGGCNYYEVPSWYHVSQTSQEGAVCHRFHRLHTTHALHESLHNTKINFMRKGSAVHTNK